MFTASGSPKLLDATDFLPETHTAGTLNAAGHFRSDQRTDILVFDNPLLLIVMTVGIGKAHGDVLQWTFAALITNRTIQGMVDQQKFQNTLLGHFCLARSRGYFHSVRHRGGTGGQGFWRFFHIHQTHPAIGGNRKFGVIAEKRDINP